MKSKEAEIKEYFYNLDRSFYMDSYKEEAEIDHAVPIGHGQTISQPSLVLKMTLLLDLEPSSKVLEIGTGSGFQTALLAAFSDSVYTVERIEPLYNKAKNRLAKAGFTNIHFKLADGSQGWEENGPYDRIMVTAAASEIPKELLDQLDNQGRMVIPIGNRFSQELTLIEKDYHGQISSNFIDYVVFVRLQGKYD